MAMQFRKTTQDDLPVLKAMYRRLTAHMEDNGVCIWDDYYPCELLAEDIEHGQLYALFDGEEPLGAFALCTENAGAEQVLWEDRNARAFYIERLGVSASHLRQGFASLMLERAAETARMQGAEYLRLFAALDNPPALELYRKWGFQRAWGVYHEVIDENWIIDEYGFEVKL